MPQQDLVVVDIISESQRITKTFKDILEENGSAYPILLVHRSPELSIVMCSHTDIGIIQSLAQAENGGTVIDDET